MKYMFSGYESRSLHPSGTAGYDRKRPANNLQYHFVVIIYVGIPICNLNQLTAMGFLHSIFVGGTDRDTHKKEGLVRAALRVV